MKKILNYIFIVLIVCLLGLAGSWLYNSSLKTQPAQSASLGNVSGYAWSLNTGWISFNGSNYGVNVDTNNGKLSGYAWSDNIGWISFNESDTNKPLSNDPCSDTSCIAKATPPGQFGKSDIKLYGWARALVACNSIPCPSSGAGSQGWDGWIRFDHGKGNEVSIDKNGDFHGFAWSSDIGWISCNCSDGPFTCEPKGGDICQANEFCPGQLILAGDTDVCCNVSCQLKTCAQQSGDICQVNENCPGTIISASDSTSCCTQTCVLKTCTQQGGDICAANEKCPWIILPASDTNNCCSASCELKTCAEQRGDICREDEECIGDLISASDTDACCSGRCRPPY
jgi:hypothetical protein